MSRNASKVSPYFYDIARIVKSPSAPLPGVVANNPLPYGQHENPKSRAPLGLKGLDYLDRIKAFDSDIQNFQHRLNECDEFNPLMDIEFLTLIRTACDYLRCEPEDIASAHGGDLKEWEQCSSQGWRFLDKSSQIKLLLDIRRELDESARRFIGLPRQRPTKISQYLEDHLYDAPALPAVTLRDPALRQLFSGTQSHETTLETSRGRKGPYGSPDDYFVELAIEIRDLESLLARIEDEKTDLSDAFMAEMGHAARLLRVHPAELFEIYEENAGACYNRYIAGDPCLDPDKQAEILIDLIEEMEQVKLELMGKPRQSKDTMIYVHAHVNPY